MIDAIFGLADLVKVGFALMFGAIFGWAVPVRLGVSVGTTVGAIVIVVVLLLVGRDVMDLDVGDGVATSS